MYRGPTARCYATPSDLISMDTGMGYSGLATSCFDSQCTSGGALTLVLRRQGAWPGLPAWLWRGPICWRSLIGWAQARRWRWHRWLGALVTWHPNQPSHVCARCTRPTCSQDAHCTLPHRLNYQPRQDLPQRLLCGEFSCLAASSPIASSRSAARRRAAGRTAAWRGRQHSHVLAVSLTSSCWLPPTVCCRAPSSAPTIPRSATRSAAPAATQHLAPASRER